jgi:phenylacetate-CoA ligase
VKIKKDRFWNPDIETMPLESLRQLQRKRLKKQINYVYSHSRFYRKKFRQAGLNPGDIKTLDDLQKLPFTEKDELRNSQEIESPFGLHLCIPRSEVAWAPSTSGTSGVPLILPRNQEDIDLWTDLNARAFWRMGLRPNDIFQNILAYHWIYSGLILHEGAKKTGACVIAAGMGNTDKQIWSILNFQVDAIFATPTYFMHLGTQLAEKNLTPKLKVRLLTGGGEIGMNTPEGKKRIRGLFPSAKTVTDNGGVTDVGTIIWAECCEESGAHICEDAVLTEILDPETGKPVPDGKEGELVFTDLISKSAPLIRYRVKDLTCYDSEPCPCGCTHGRLPRGIFGRIDDMITVRSANIYPVAIENIIKSNRQLNGEYQIVVERVEELDRLIIRAEYNQEIINPKEVEAEIKSKFRILCGSSAEVELLPPGRLPRFVYKAKRVIDRRKGETEEDIEKRARAQERM